MRKRLFVALAAAGAMVVAAGLSAAGTLSARGVGPTTPAPDQNVTRALKNLRPAAEKPTAPKRPSARKATRAVGPSSGPVSRPTSDGDVASYWTPERMRNAQPVDKGVRGGSPPSSTDAPARRTAPSSSQPSKRRPAKKVTKKTTSTPASGPQEDGPVASPASGDPAGYWTPERMDDAQPMEKTVPGGDGPEENTGSGPPTVTIPPP